MHYGHKASNESRQLDYSLETAAARDGPAGRSVEESIPSALLALEFTGQL